MLKPGREGDDTRTEPPELYRDETMPVSTEMRKNEELRRISQELKTATNAIEGVAGLLQSTPLDPDQTEYLATIRDGTASILKLADQLEAEGAPGSRRPATRLVEKWGPEVEVQEIGPNPDAARLLLVEDNLINRRVITRLLERLGHHVDTAANGMEALEAVKEQDFDLVFMDLRMPIMDGLEATQRIREDVDENRQPWIVALTTAVLPGDRKACLDAGADDYLSKPVRTEDLENAIVRARHGDGQQAA